MTFCSNNSPPLAILDHPQCPVCLFFLKKITILSLYIFDLDSALIYFVKDGQYLPPKSGTTYPSVTSAVGFNENATLPFEPGKTYRLRIVNTGAFNSLFFWIDGHEMIIIEADGVCFLFPFDEFEMTICNPDRCRRNTSRWASASCGRRSTVFTSHHCPERHIFELGYSPES